MNSRGNRHNNNTRGTSRGAGATSRHGNMSANRPPQNAHHQVPVHVHALAPKDQADLDVFRAALKELTFNSRPIIEKLTAMARERARTIPGPVSRTILDNLVFVSNQNVISTITDLFLFRIIQITAHVSSSLSIPSSKPLVTPSPLPSSNTVSSQLTCAYLGKFVRRGMNSKRETF